MITFLIIMGVLVGIFLLFILYFYLLLKGFKKHWRQLVWYTVYEDKDTKRLQFSITVMTKDKQIGMYRKINGRYTAWVMGIGRLETTYKSGRDAFKAIKSNYALEKGLK